MYTITFGGWYQRTTLHLSEIYDFLALGKTKIGLNKDKVLRLKEKLDLKEVTREVDYLEYVKAKTNNGIEIRYYEDGLYILEKHSNEPLAGHAVLEEYFDEVFNPAISYIFSLGAPVPKMLAEMKIDHPTVVSTKAKTIKIDESIYGEIYSEIETDTMSVYKTPKYIFVASEDRKHAVALIEMQIFFREFKDQLERYLNIHREIWEDISEYKEKRYIIGKDLEEARNYLDGCQKTVSLIGSRINQMNSYLNTRLSIAKKLNVEEKLSYIFQYKFETLMDTHVYIKEIWKMTTDYLNAAIQVVQETRTLANTNTLQSLTWITTIGVVASIIGYLSKDQLPKFTLIGAWYYVMLIILTMTINRVVQIIAKNKKYTLKFNQNHND